MLVHCSKINIAAIDGAMRELELQHKLNAMSHGLLMQYIVCNNFSKEEPVFLHSKSQQSLAHQCVHLTLRREETEHAEKHQAAMQELNEIVKAAMGKTQEAASEAMASIDRAIAQFQAAASNDAGWGQDYMVVERSFNHCFLPSAFAAAVTSHLLFEFARGLDVGIAITPRPKAGVSRPQMTTFCAPVDQGSDAMIHYVGRCSSILDTGVVPKGCVDMGTLSMKTNDSNAQIYSMTVTPFPDFLALVPAWNVRASPTPTMQFHELKLELPKT